MYQLIATHLPNNAIFNTLFTCTVKDLLYIKSLRIGKKYSLQKYVKYNLEI